MRTEAQAVYLAITFNKNDYSVLIQLITLTPEQQLVVLLQYQQL